MDQPNLGSLPVELLLMIGEYSTCRELFALASTSCRLWRVFSLELYRKAGKTLCYGRALFWTVVKQMPWAVEAVLRGASKFNLQLIWLSCRSIEDVSYFTCSSRFEK
jgi:hypothetical protein